MYLPSVICPVCEWAYHVDYIFAHLFRDHPESDITIKIIDNLARKLIEEIEVELA